MRKQERSENGPSEPRRPKAVPESPPWGRAWVLVVVLLVIPGALYAAITAVPFLPLTTAQKVGLAAGLAIAAEVTFLLSALVLGREAVRRYPRIFDPRTWFRSRQR